MKPLRRLTNPLVAYTVAVAAFGQLVLATELVKDPFITDNARRQHFEPDSKYHLFDNPRGSVANRTSKVDVTQVYTHQMSSLFIQQTNINGTIGYRTRFSGHGYEVHIPFDNHANRNASEEKDSVNRDFTVYCLNWGGHEHHPTDGCDGPQGGNYPRPVGTRGEYTYNVNSVTHSIELGPTDIRDVRQRISDNYSNLGSNSSDRACEANRKVFEHNFKLDCRGNNMELTNGVAAGVLNPSLSAGEVLGIGDILYETGYAIDKAAMCGIPPLSAGGKLAAIGGLGGVMGFEKNMRGAVDRWIQENPNAVETVETASNVATAAKAVKLARAAKPGKTAVSGDLSKSYACSFHNGILVKTADGYKAIARIRVGDHAFAKDKASEETEYKPVTTQYGNPYQETAYIEASDDFGKIQTPVSNRIHPFYSDDKWIKVEDLKAGNRLSSESSAKQTV